MKKLYSWQTEMLGSIFVMNIRVCLVLLLGCSIGHVPIVFAQEPDVEEGAFYRIAKDGTGDYGTISEAVEQAQSGDTLVIYPGVYTEAVVIEEKTLNLIGVDKDSCILQWNTASYEQVPLNIGAGTVKNLTIYGMREEDNTKEEKEVPKLGDVTQATPDEWNRYFSGYAVHMDQEYSYEKEIVFENCNIVSEHNYCVGIGCRGGSSITFQQCDMISAGDGGCLYLHDAIGMDGGSTDVMLQDCNLTNYLPPYVMTLEAFRDTNEINLTFQNVCVSTVAYDQSDVYDTTNLNTGYEIAELSQWDQLGLLYDMGYTSTVPGSLVHALSLKESADYINQITKDGSILHKKLSLSEGITVLSLLKKVKQTEADRKCMAIRILNEDGVVGEGWCGSTNVWLTKESYGNTLIEMNAIPIN